jgi:hypothetical protein
MFNIAYLILIKMDFEAVFNPAAVQCVDDKSWEWCMRHCAIPMLMKSDVAWFLPGWQNSKGAKIEHDLCGKLGIEVRYFALAIEHEPEF